MSHLEDLARNKRTLHTVSIEIMSETVKCLNSRLDEIGFYMDEYDVSSEAEADEKIDFMAETLKEKEEGLFASHMSHRCSIRYNLTVHLHTLTIVEHLLERMRVFLEIHGDLLAPGFSVEDLEEYEDDASDWSNYEYGHLNEEDRSDSDDWDEDDMDEDEENSLLRSTDECPSLYTDRFKFPKTVVTVSDKYLTFFIHLSLRIAFESTRHPHRFFPLI